jgi:hypothetical protein
MKLLLLRSRGRSHEARAGVSATAVTSERSRSTPTGMPKRKSRSPNASLPMGVETG